jgi:CheY-like chemotaxis protein
MSVTGASTADDAINELTIAAGNGERFDVTVVDHHPPELDGTALITRAYRDSAIPSLACVLLSRDPSAEHETTNLEGVDVLAKPVGPSALYNYLLRQLRPHQHQSLGLPTPDTAPPARRTRGLILLAEDNEINQLVAVDTLNTLGYDADIARNGAEAVELASTNTYQAILMDCQMPKLDGYQATRELRRREGPGRHIPIIAMTAGVLHEDREHAHQAGMDDFLAKPIDTDDLRAALDRWTADAPTNT